MRERIRVQDIGLGSRSNRTPQAVDARSLGRPAGRSRTRLRHGREPAAEIHDPRAVSRFGQAVGGNAGGRGSDLEACAGGRHGAGHASRRWLQPAGHCVWSGAVLGQRPEPDLRRQGSAAGQRGTGNHPAARRRAIGRGDRGVRRFAEAGEGLISVSLLAWRAD